MTLITALGNEKGGVGKTTLALSLAAEFAAKDQRVLVVDLDPQVHASSTIYTAPSGASTIVDLLARKPAVTLDDVTAASQWSGVDVVPGSPAIEELERDADPLAFMRLRRHLRSTAAEKYDQILIDLPPSVSTKTVSALYAAHRVLAVTTAEPWSLVGLNSFLEALGELREGAHPKLEVTGVVVNKFQKNLTEHRTGINELRDALGDLLLEPFIPNRVGLVALASYGQPPAHAKDASGREAAAAIAQIAQYLLDN